MDRRHFLKDVSVAAAAVAVTPAALSCSGKNGTAPCKIVASQETKVLIIGGGPAGVCAAIASARLGIPTLIVEEGGCLGDIAPTLIEMMGMEKPEEMTGESLLIKK